MEGCGHGESPSRSSKTFSSRILGGAATPARTPPPVTALALGLQDFGDYQDGYYSVQTTEGEQIAQLIAGYIDIILKKVGLRWVGVWAGEEGWLLICIKGCPVL